MAGDGIVQGDPRITNSNGELIGTSSNPLFGTSVINRFFDPDWAFGWGKRFANWEFSGGIQHELADGLSMNVSVFRRVYVSYSAVNNRAVNPADYDGPFCLTTPTNSLLPNSGQQLCGLFEISDAAFGTAADNITISADNFGSRTSHWNGVDITFNARMDNGLLLQGGLSTGKTSTDICDLNANLNNPSQLYCKTDTPFLTQVKLLGSYTLPWDVQIAGTLQSLPGQQLQANVTYTQADIEAALGRPVQTGNRTVGVIEPGSLYGDRLLQVDLRATKNIAFGAGQYRRSGAVPVDVRSLQRLQRQHAAELQPKLRSSGGRRSGLAATSVDHPGSVGEVRVPDRLLGVRGETPRRTETGDVPG